MFFLFKSKKPKTFNYKPVYQDNSKKNSDKEEEFHFEKHANLADKMYERWDKIPYKELLETGKKKMMYSMIALVVIIVLIILNLQKLVSWLEQFE